MLCVEKKERKITNVSKCLPAALPCIDGASAVETTSPPSDYLPFLMDGFVSLCGQDYAPRSVKMLRDTGAAQSFILEGVLLFSEKSAFGVLVRGFEMGYTYVPMHAIMLQSGLVKGRVIVGVCQNLPVEGVSFILGNYLAGGKVLVNPEVISVPLVPNESDIVKQFPSVFPSCAVTRAIAKVDVETAKDSDLCGNVLNLN